LEVCDDELILPLLDDLGSIPEIYKRQVASIKRVLERWTMDPLYREEYATNPAAAITRLGVDLRPEEVTPLIDEKEGRELTRAIRAGEEGRYPIAVRRYRAFYSEKRLHRRQIRRRCQSSNPRVAAWRSRQIARCMNELGIRKADALVHAPMAIELAKGCSVGCWFCGVSARKLEQTWPYTESNAALWQGCLETLSEVLGDCAKQGFLYWATDPLDNPDYEHFLKDFHRILGRCPQTTTAMGARNIERTRRLLELSSSLHSEIDRFSILTLGMLEKIHQGFRPEEMLRVECVPQNRESSDKYRKANAGRARTFQDSRAPEMMPEEVSSTIACVSGFLFNMVDQKVQLVTPCNATPRWPLGYWVVEEAYFQSGAELREVLNGIIERQMPPSLGLDYEVCLRPGTEVYGEGTDLVLQSRWLKFSFHKQKGTELMAKLLREGNKTAADLALEREAIDGTPLEETFLLLEDIFKRGFIDEEPRKVKQPQYEFALV
jgi:radical SAM family RiPP maturation amino acid epimerase